MNIDFIHIGFHKTASTWMQNYGYPLHPNIVLLNDIRSGMDKYFYDEFIGINEYCYEAGMFKERFFSKVELIKKLQNQSDTLGICEENLSGVSWTGCNSKLLADRILDTFGPVKIIMTLRNQLDMINSLYSNYIMVGGARGLRDLIHYFNMGKDKIIQKLQYDHIIKYYFEHFGSRNTKIVFYEDFCKNANDYLAAIYGFIGVPVIDLPRGIVDKKLNPGLSLHGNNVVRKMNHFLPCAHRQDQKLKRNFRKVVRKGLWMFFKPSPSDRHKLLKILPPYYIDAWKMSNFHTRELINRELPDDYLLDY